MGRYVPPDQEGVQSGNQLHKKHPLGARASKLAAQGVLTVRFEMPFAVWCGTCAPARTVLIGQGTRFNAEKCRVGAYHSTPVFAFRVRHAACGGAIEIRTDPQNTAYVVAAGGSRRDTGDDDDDDDSLVRKSALEPGRAVVPGREQADVREAAFSSLEKTIADRARTERATRRIDELHEAASRHWDDPYTRNQRLRRTFRQGRKAREKEAAAADQLKDGMGLGFDLLPGTEEDARRVALVSFGDAPDGDTEGEDKEDHGSRRDGSARRALSKPLFPGVEKEEKRAERVAAGPERKPRWKSEMTAAKSRSILVPEIMDNTRAAKDPFLDFGVRDWSRAPTKIQGRKRKRKEEEEEPPGAGAVLTVPDASTGGEDTSGAATPGHLTALVNYASDSD